MISEETRAIKSGLLKWLLSTLVFLFLLMGSMGKFIQLEAVVKGSEELGFNENDIIILGIILLLCSIVYMIPKFSAIGAILLKSID